MITSLAPLVNSVAIMGGTFDPIHNGHLRVAVEVLDLAIFDELRLVPCYTPVHKGSPSVTVSQRLAMMQLGVAGDARLRVDDREILRATPSFSLETLKELRHELGPEKALTMVIGMDSFLSLPTWKGWQSLMHYAHILVVSRPGWELDLQPELNHFCENYRACSVAELQCAPAGKLWFETLTALSISSSMIRSLNREGKSIAYLVPEPVQTYINANKLYR